MPRAKRRPIVQFNCSGLLIWKVQPHRYRITTATGEPLHITPTLSDALLYCQPLEREAYKNAPPWKRGFNNQPLSPQELADPSDKLMHGTKYPPKNKNGSSDETS